MYKDDKREKKHNNTENTWIVKIIKKIRQIVTEQYVLYDAWSRVWNNIAG